MGGEGRVLENLKKKKTLPSIWKEKYSNIVKDILNGKD